VSNDKRESTFSAPIAYLAAVASLHRRTVERRLEDLERLGLVTIRRQQLRVAHTFTLTTLSRNDGTHSRSDTTAREGNFVNPLSHLIRREEQKKERTPTRVARGALKAEEASEHQALVADFGEAYADAFGVAYKFAGGKDGKAVKELLSGGRTREEILSVAKRAWSKLSGFLHQQASTLHGLNSKWNEIQTALAGGHKPIAAFPVKGGAQRGGMDPALREVL
jgi:hypothetical protein